MSESSSTSSVARSQQAAAKGAFAKMALTGFVLIGLAAAGVFFTFQFAENERARELKQWQIRLGIVADSRFADIDGWIDGQLGELTALAENASLQLYMSLLEDAGTAAADSPEAGFLGNLLTVVAERAGFKGDVKGAEVQANVEPTSYTHELTFDGRENAVFKSDFIPLEEREEMPAGVLMVSQDITDSIRERERHERVLKQLVGALVSVVDRRDPYSANHSTRVGVVSRAIAEEMELPAIDVETAEIAGNLMNLGKITVPEEVLTKTDKLTDAEFDMIRESVFTSADLVKDIEFDGNVSQTLRSLQEHVDGSGVPDGLAGEDIALSARIVAVANAFVGMVSARSWRQGMDFDKAIGFLMEDVGRKFDRRVVTALANYIDNRGGRDAWKSFGETPEAAE